MGNAPPLLNERLRLLAEADELFEGAVLRHQTALTANGCSAEGFEEAAHIFYSAAIQSRGLGLGQKARDALSRSAECHRELAEGHERAAKRCEESRDAIDIIWEDTQ